MKYFVYIFSRDGQSFHPGFCKDIERTIKSYAELPGMDYPPKPNRLVFLEEVKDKESAHKRFDEIIALTKKAKIALIEANHQRSNNLVYDLNINV